METVFNADHVLHVSPGELLDGAFVPAFEKPERAALIRARLDEVKLGPVRGPDPFPLAPIEAVHDPRMVALFQAAHAEWAALDRPGAAIPYTFGAHGMRQDRVPSSLDGRLAFFAFDAGTPITATSWQAIKASADTALTAARLMGDGREAAFALCRPPGHHAGTDHYGGYCFLNNAAIAAEALIGAGAGRVAILDVDYHHGNGTQNIFYRRGDVFVVSLHADPNVEYPYRLGFADEAGEGQGEGFNANYPLPHGTEWPAWSAALDDGIARVRDYGPDVIVVSLGVDTFRRDPISRFRLDHEHFTRMGARIAALRKPTLFVMEGGYAVAEIGINTVNVLSGYADG